MTCTSVVAKKKRRRNPISSRETERLDDVCAFFHARTLLFSLFRTYCRVGLYEITLSGSVWKVRQRRKRDPNATNENKKVLMELRLEPAGGFFSPNRVR